MNGSLSSHVFVSIVRLTVETNLVTSKDLTVFDATVYLSSHACLATVSFVALLIFCLKLVSGAMHVCPSVEIDASNTGLELVYVPVCIQLHFINSCHACYLINSTI